ncbi:MAG: DUF4258 domain-containing protein [Minisyncoccia bacterium]
MRFKIPQDSETIVWTKHAIEKMIQYQLSESRVRRVLHTPHRIEEGIAPETIAAMQSVGTKKHPKEIWVMFQKVKIKKPKNKLSKDKIRIISVWRYPGVTPIRQLPNLPPEEWEILKSGILLE